MLPASTMEGGMMRNDTRHGQGSVTASAGIGTFVGFDLVATPADLLTHADAGTTVRAVMDAHEVAELRLDGGFYFMSRRDALGSVVGHRLCAAHTDAERLASHWTGFCTVALQDHMTLNGRFRVAA